MLMLLIPELICKQVLLFISCIYDITVIVAK